MYRWIFSFILLSILVACNSDKLPTNDDFVVKVRTVNKTAKVNEEIEIITELINKSNKTFLIKHSNPLVTVQAYDKNDKPLYEYLVVDDVGLSHKFKSKETYNPNEEWKPNEKRIIKIDKPGRYELIGNASFLIDQSNGERQEYSLKSQPYEILIEE
ncbi:hypothetical protein [Cohnella lupini]|uniref:Intracellular proteinase inhibitor BsuPI n=1 Tax=Cohnella lupini TaxID=1294267 RepID=A0A3D9IBW4_9BACL|nr:hypothetical protein [Cohnella lupini]RED59171.1 hypothetical protein DFP95_1079 [Cohnella lupini]